MSLLFFFYFFQAFGIEFLITFLLVTVVFASAADDDNAPNVSGSVPLAIGLSITTCHLLAVSFLPSTYIDNKSNTLKTCMIITHAPRASSNIA